MRKRTMLGVAVFAIIATAALAQVSKINARGVELLQAKLQNEQRIARIDRQQANLDNLRMRLIERNAAIEERLDGLAEARAALRDEPTTITVSLPVVIGEWIDD